MANDKIDSLKINSTTYDIDLPADASPSIASLAVTGNVSAATFNSKSFTTTLGDDDSTIPTSKAVVDALGSAYDYKLDKITYEWNESFELNTNPGNPQYMQIGVFPVSTSNITIDIGASITASSSNRAYSGVLVISTSGVTTSSKGSTYSVLVYNDPTGDLANMFSVVWSSGSDNYTVYFVPKMGEESAVVSKCVVHIRASALNGLSSVVDH